MFFGWVWVGVGGQLAAVFMFPGGGERFTLVTNPPTNTNRGCAEARGVARVCMGFSRCVVLWLGRLLR